MSRWSVVDSEANAAVQSLLDDLVSSGEELGLQVAAYHQGKLAIDAWAGFADARTGRKVDGDTLFTVFSTTKGITCTAIHILAERGLLGYDDPVARYWPAFAARGKGRVTVRQVLTHTAGAPQMPDGVTPVDICDWDRICTAIADLPLLWEPGTMTGYHAFTIGWILGEVLRRIDSRPIAQFVKDEFCAPLGLRNLFLGIPDEIEARVAFLEDGPLPKNGPEPMPLLSKAIPEQLPAAAALFNRPDVRRASIPAAGGIMNARDLARHYASLATGVDGVRLHPPAGCPHLTRTDPCAGPGDRFEYPQRPGVFPTWGKRRIHQRLPRLLRPPGRGRVGRLRRSDARPGRRLHQDPPDGPA
jgi:CubicO group peptidase (beta-lactamase class C family)